MSTMSCVNQDTRVFSKDERFSFKAQRAHSPVAYAVCDLNFQFLAPYYSLCTNSHILLKVYYDMNAGGVQRYKLTAQCSLKHRALADLTDKMQLG